MKNIFFSGTEKNCYLDGMVCLKANEDNINTLINPWEEGQGTGMPCTCMQSCEELGFRLVSLENETE
jgi:hypothetical protein